MKKNLTILTVIIILVCCAFLARKSLYSWYKTERLDISLPPAELVTLSGDTLHLSDYQGRVLVLEFWASWCAPCRRVFPEVEEVYLAYKNNSQVAFIAVNNSRRDWPEDATQFLDSEAYTIPVAHDFSRVLKDSLITRGIPTYCIVDRAGKVRIRHSGYRPFWEDYADDLRRNIEFVLSTDLE